MRFAQCGRRQLRQIAVRTGLRHCARVHGHIAVHIRHRVLPCDYTARRPVDIRVREEIKRARASALKG